MLKEKLILNWPVLTKEIEKTLDTYHPSYQEAFALSELRLKLVADVLIRICNFYAVIIEDAQDSSVNPLLLHLSSEQRLHIEALVKQGIYRILQKKHRVG